MFTVFFLAEKMVFVKMIPEFLVVGEVKVESISVTKVTKIVIPPQMLE